MSVIFCLSIIYFIFCSISIFTIFLILLNIGFIGLPMCHYNCMKNLIISKKIRENLENKYIDEIKLIMKLRPDISEVESLLKEINFFHKSFEYSEICSFIEEVKFPLRFSSNQYENNLYRFETLKEKECFFEKALNAINEYLKYNIKPKFEGDSFKEYSKELSNIIAKSIIRYLKQSNLENFPVIILGYK